MQEPKDLITNIRTVLKHEITWAIFIGGFIVSTYNFVIIPIIGIQTQLASIQASLTDIKEINSDYEDRITQNANDLIRLKERLGIQ